MPIDMFSGGSTVRSPVYARSTAVVTGHSLASLAALDVLDEGGSIVDAMISASAVLTVVLPHATSLGGDLFALYTDGSSGQTVGMNASGRATSAASPEALHAGIAGRGAGSATVPGIVGGWQAMHNRYGSLPWPKLFDPAITLAKEGHPMSQVLASALHLFGSEWPHDHPIPTTFRQSSNRAARPGDLLQLPALAESLQRIASGGADAFYQGAIAQSVVSHVRAQGGLLSLEDFHGYAPEWVQPLATDFRECTVEVMPPNSYGLLLLLQLNGLTGLDASVLSTMTEAERLARLIKAYQVGYEWAAPHIADGTKSSTLDGLLGAETTQHLRRSIADVSPTHLKGGPGGTACIVIADGKGNAISVAQSIFTVFGSGVIDPETGIILNNRMRGFVADPAHANAVGPFKRPAHTLCPVIVKHGSALRYVLATPGGPGQTIILTQLLTNLVDLEMPLTAAIDRPRWGVSLDGAVLLEPGFEMDVLEGLGRWGISGTRSSTISYFGSAKCIEVMPHGILAAAADLRREAYSVGR